MTDLPTTAEYRKIADGLALPTRLVIGGEKVAATIDTGVGFVTKENMNEPDIAELMNPPLAKYLK